MSVPSHSRNASSIAQNGDALEPSGRELSVRKSVAEVRREGWLFRESGYIDSIVNPRYGALYPHALVTFREATADMPTKVWPLHPLCRLGELQGGSFLVRGRNSNLLLALATQHTKKRALMFFTIDWPHNHIFGAEHLKLCFEDVEDARQWHVELTRAIGELTLAPDPAQRSMRREGSRRRLARARTPDQERARTPERERTLTATDRSTDSDAFSSPFKATTSEDDVGHIKLSTAPMADAEVEPDGHAVTEPAPHHRWASFRHVNGVAVFREDFDANGEGGAMMVSTIIRAAPRAVWKALMDLDPSNHFMFPFFSACVLEVKDENTRIVKGWLQSEGLASSLCAPREAVVEQIWRKDEDGTYIVLMQSTEHPKAPPAAGGLLHWYTPVRAEVVACGYTIAPLQPKYQGSNGSTESLVTMVLKLNPGGWLSPTRHLRHGLASLLGDRFRPLLNSFVEPLLLSVITLRDKVEQERFVVKPFSMGQQAGPDDSSTAPDTPRIADLDRSTTRIVRQSMVQRRASSFLPAASANLGVAAKRPLVPTAAEQSAGIQEGADVISDADYPHGTLDTKFWSYPGAAGFKVRGPSYLHNKKKVPTEEPLFALNSADLTESDEKVWEIGRFLPSIRNNTAPFTFVLNLIVPGPPWRNLVMSWSADYNPAAGGSSTHSRTHTPKTSVAGSMIDGHGPRSVAAPSVAGGSIEDGSDSECDTMSPFDIALARFLSGEGPAADKNCSNRFKLIPSVLHGSWVIKQAVGNTPVLLGNKLVTRYYRCDKYFEMDVDIGSSYAACSVVNLVKGATKSMVINFGICVEGQAEDELPERLIGTCQFAHLDMEAGMYLDPEGKLHHKADLEPGVRRALSRRDSKLKSA